MTSNTLKTDRSLVVNIGANWTALVLSVVTGLLVTPLIIRMLGTEVYGIWATLASITAQSILFDFGVRTALARHVAAASAQNDRQQIGKLITGALVILTLAASAALLLGDLLIYFLPSIVSIDPFYEDVARFVLMVLIVDACTELMSGVSEGALAGYEKYLSLARASIVRSVLYSAGILVLFLCCDGSGMWTVVQGVLLLTVGTRLIQRLLLALVLRRTAPPVSVAVNASTFGELWKFGLPAWRIALGQRLIFNCDVLIVALFFGPVAAGMFSVPAIMCEQLRSLAQAGSTVLTPRMTALLGSDRRTELDQLLRRWIIIAQYLGWYLCFMAFILGNLVISIWAGPAFAAGAPILALLAASYLFTLPSFAATSFAFAAVRHERMARIFLLEGIVNLVLSLALAVWLGPIGVAVASLLPALVVRGWYLPRAYLPIPARDLTLLQLRPLVPALLQGLSMYLVLSVSAPGSWLTLVYCGFVGTVAFLVGAGLQERLFAARSRV